MILLNCATLFGLRISAISITQAEKWLILRKNSQIFITMATRVGHGQISMIPLNCTTSETPALCKKFGDISYTKRDKVNFVLKLANFRYLGNKGQSWVNLRDIVKLCDLKSPLFGARISVISVI